MINRLMSQKDFVGIHKLVLQVHELHITNRADIYNDIDPFTKEYFEFLLYNTNTIALVAENDNKIIGFCVLTLREPSENPLRKARNVAYMEDLVVDEEYRKSGIGKSLFNEIKILAKQRGADVMELMVWDFNDNAINFYQNMGMTTRSIILEQKL